MTAFGDHDLRGVGVAERNAGQEQVPWQPPESALDRRAGESAPAAYVVRQPGSQPAVIAGPGLRRS